MKNDANPVSTNLLARALGGVALGLGAAQLVAPRHVAKVIGLRPSTMCLGTLRLLGLRESMSGLGVLRGRHSSGWLGWRLAGDALDAGLLLGAMRGRRGLFRRRRAGRLGLTLAAVGGVAALDTVALALQAARKKRGAAFERPSVSASITIARPATDLYGFWRNVENLPRFVSFVERVEARDRSLSHWRARLPHGPTVEWDALVVDDRPGQRITWKLAGKAVRYGLDSGEVTFRPAPGGQGTEVHLSMWSSQLKSPRLLNQWLRKLPGRFWAMQLRRFKQLMELGEIVESDASQGFGPHPAQPSVSRGETRPASRLGRGQGGNGQGARAS